MVGLVHDQPSLSQVRIAASDVILHFSVNKNTTSDFSHHKDSQHQRLRSGLNYRCKSPVVFVISLLQTRKCICIFMLNLPQLQPPPPKCVALVDLQIIL